LGQGIGVYFQVPQNHHNLEEFYREGAIRPLVCGEEGFSIKPYFFFLCAPYAPSWLFSLHFSHIADNRISMRLSGGFTPACCSILSFLVYFSVEHISWLTRTQDQLSIY
jgi:hypothetical protein